MKSLLVEKWAIHVGLFLWAIFSPAIGLSADTNPEEEVRNSLETVKKLDDIQSKEVSLPHWHRKAIPKPIYQLEHFVIPQKSNRYLPKFSRSFAEFDFPEVSEEELDFFPEDGLVPDTQSDSIDQLIATAIALREQVELEGRYVDQITAEMVLDLPVGISKTIGNLKYIVVFDRMIIHPSFVEVSAYMTFVVPQNGKSLTFYARSIKISDGGGIIGDARLELMGNNIIKLNGDKSILRLKGGNLANTDIGAPTYVEVDCNGFKEMSISADLEFSKSIFLREGPDGQILNERMKVSFQTILSDWNDMVVSVSLPPFQVKGLKGVGFEIQNAVFDFSDTRNAPGVRFPQGYESTMFIEGNRNLWRGIYIGQASIRLPKQFKEQGRSDRVSFSAYNLLIDNMGFSGTLVAENLISLEKGRMGDWAFSLDNIGVTLEANKLVDAGFSGLIQVPLMDERSYFNYGAIIRPGNDYLFTISNQDSIKFSVWNADVNLHPSSFIEVKSVEDEFLPVAVLSGEMTVNASLNPDGATESGGKGVELANIGFERLMVQTVQPYVSVGGFSLGSEAATSSMGGFPVSINEVYARSTPTEMMLGLDLKLSLVGGEGGFGADGKIAVVGRKETFDGLSRWSFKGVDIERFGIDIDQGAFKLNGTLDFFKYDPNYGKGIAGQISMYLEPGFELEAKALFGNVDGFRYWYVDALAAIPGGAPLGGPLVFNGFGGGLSYRMEQVPMGNRQGDIGIGKSNSGVLYRPDKDAGLGVKASVRFSLVGSQSLFYGDAGFEMIFNRHGGIRQFSILGNAYFLSIPTPATVEALARKAEALAATTNREDVKNAYPVDPKSQFWGRLLLTYDAPSRTLHGNLGAYVNVAGGLIRGVGENNAAGEAVLHFSPDEWYILIGTPDNRVGLEILRLAKTESYFMVGNSIPGSPPPAENVSQILGGIDLDYMRDENALGTGGGLAFGSRLSIDTGDLNFLIFYARFGAGLGFDVMLKNYGSVTCANRGGSSLGINGWYANGQAYAWVQGDIGLQFKLFGRKKKIPILEIGAAAILQAKLPNPSWMRGAVGGYFSVLGGLVKGNCRFEFTIGEECEMMGGSPLEGIQVISQITPGNGSKDVNVFTSPQAVFNMEIDKVFEMLDEAGERRQYKIMLDGFAVFDGTTPVSGELKWNSTHDVLVFESFEVLPPQKQLIAAASVSFQEYTNGSWKLVKVDGEVFRETMSSKFTTGEAPEVIPADNVAYAYPGLNQYNFYPEEHKEGYLILKTGQSYLFDNSDPNLTIKGRYQESYSSGPAYFDVRYDNGKKMVRYPIPGDLVKEKVHAFQIVNLPREQASALDANVTEASTQIVSGDTKVDAEIRTRTAKGTVQTVEEKLVFESYFRTSKYSTFIEKIDGITKASVGWRKPITAGVHQLNLNLSGVELFDFDETGDYGTIDNAIQFVADLDNTKWYTSKVKPLLYNQYPWLPQLAITDRDINYYGLPPKRAVFINTLDQLSVNDELIQNGTIVASTQSVLNYNVPLVVHQDYLEMQRKAVNYYLYAGSTGRVKNLIEQVFPRVLKGNYPIEMRYVLPGINKVTSTRKIVLVNPLGYE